MRILVVGDGHSTIHELAVSSALSNLGHEVESFYWHRYFSSQKFFNRYWLKLQRKFLFGPAFMKLNSKLLDCVGKFSPNLVFIYRGTHVTPHTVEEIRLHAPGCKIFGYNNDDPFASGYPWWVWRHFLSSVPLYDVVFAYRNHNVSDFLEAGAKRVELLRSWYIPEIHKPIRNQSLEPSADCIFVGHYENDGRAECLEALVNAGVKIRLFGPFSGLKSSGWDRPVSKSLTLQKLLPISYLTGTAYAKEISESKIGLCFFSKLNRDTYTRRCFEIPAIGAALFTEYSEDIASLFEDGVDAVFFRDREELVSKVLYYLANPADLENIRKNGRARVQNDGHDIYSRLRKVVMMVDEA